MFAMFAVLNQHNVPCLIGTETRCMEYAAAYGGRVIRWVAA